MLPHWWRFFCVIMQKNLLLVEETNARFYEMMDAMRREEARLPHVSVGYARFQPEHNNIEDTVSEADAMMYRCKEQHKAAKQKSS